MIQQLLKVNIPEVTSILKMYKVKRAYAFGSVCTNHFNESSDVDLLIAFEDGLDPIEYGENYFKIMYALQKLLKREVDLITERSLKNPYFIKVMNLTKTPIYE